MSTVLKSSEFSTETDSASLQRLWAKFLQPATPSDYLDAWLGLLCSQIRGAVNGVVLLQSTDSAAFAPVALWPATPRDLSHLGEVAQKALMEGRGTHQRASADPSSPIQVAYPVGRSGSAAVVVLEVAPKIDSDIQESLRTLHWGTGWLQEFLTQGSTQSLERTVQRVGSVMEVIATSLRRGTVRESIFGIANDIAQQLACSRVVIGLVERGSVRVVAMSDAAWFEKNADATKRYTAAMEESLDRATSIRFCATNSISEEPHAPSHAELAQLSNAQAIMTLPLTIQERTIGVLTLERSSGSAQGPAFDRNDVEWLDALTALLPSIIEERLRAERGFMARLFDDVRTFLSRLFGPRYLIWKLCAAVALAVLCVLTLVEIDYRVTAKTSIEGEIQRTAAAPFEGFIATAAVRAGDVVKKGDVLCTLDDRDLRLERDRWFSEREQRLGELRAAMAAHELTQVQVITAQLQQAEAQFALATEQIQRAQVRAPFDGVVISGDLSQLIGSPVETGKKLFEIAPLTEYRVILQVDETEIRHIRAGQHGSLLISGITSESLPLHISKITPVATAKDGRNYFRVEAQLASAPPNLRPGMEGIGKVVVGERRLWWILTHSFTNWLQISLWKWMP